MAFGRLVRALRLQVGRGHRRCKCFLFRHGARNFIFMYPQKQDNLGMMIWSTSVMHSCPNSTDTLSRITITWKIAQHGRGLSRRYDLIKPVNSQESSLLCSLHVPIANHSILSIPRLPMSKLLLLLCTQILHTSALQVQRTSSPRPLSSMYSSKRTHSIAEWGDFRPVPITNQLAIIQITFKHDEVCSCQLCELFGLKLGHPSKRVLRRPERVGTKYFLFG